MRHGRRRPRDRLRARYLELLRREGRWERLAEADPTDEAAHRELMRQALADGSRPEAIRWYGRLRTALRREMGLRPGAETEGVYDECVAGLMTQEPEFVGRELELASLAALLRSPAGGALVVRGQGGIGKTAFCRELARAGREQGWTVVATAATEATGPYGPLLDVLDRRPELLDALDPHARDVLEQLAAPAGGLTRHKVIGAARVLLEAAAGDGPVAFVVDDAHLADEATLDLLPHLGGEILVVLAYRPEAAPGTLVRGVSRAARAGRLTAIDLGPLEPDQAASLVAAGTTVARDEATVRRIIALGQGNPFLVLELARSATVGVPALVPTVRDAIASRFLDLDESAVTALRRLAVSGDDLDPVAAAALTGLPEPEAFAILDAGLFTGALVVADGHYRFRHDLVRQALLEQLAPHRRIAIHRETAERLDAVDAAPALIGRHWVAGGLPGRATPFLLAAARDAVGVGAYADALALLDRLLAHDPGHAEALVLRAESLDARGEASAPAAYAAAAAAIGRTDRGRPARQRCAGHDQARRSRGRTAACRGIAAVDPPGPDRRGVRPMPVPPRWASATPPKAPRRRPRRACLRSSQGDPMAVSVASWAQAAAAHARGELRDSVRADLFDTASLPRLAVSAFDGQLCITQRLLYGARPYDDVIAFADALAAESDRLGAERGRAFATTIRGEAKLLAGRLDEADADLCEGARLHHELGGPTGEAFSLQRRAEVALYRGDREAAERLIDEALVLARTSDVGYHLFDRIYGTRIEMAETPAAALAALEEAEAMVRGPDETCPGCRITLALPAAKAATIAGDTKRSDEWTGILEYLAGTVMKLPAWDAALEELRGLRASGGESVAHFEAAAEQFAAAGHPLDEARCRGLAGAV